MNETPAAALLLVLTLAACGEEAVQTAGTPAAPAAPAQIQLAGELSLTVTGTETSPDGRMCAFDIAAANATGRDVVNVQVAYMATTTDDRNLSEYRELGDFAADEQKDGRIFVTDSPCDEVAALRMVRAVCTLAPVADPPESCAHAVTLDGGGVIETLRDE